jgi:hypothetical protein
MSKKVSKKRRWFWDESYLVKAYRLAKDGMSNGHIAQALGVQPKVFAGWVAKKPALQQALEQARQEQVSKGKLQDFVYQRLSPKVKKVWDSLLALRKDGPDARAANSLLDQYGKTTRQKIFLYAVLSGTYTMSEAYKMTGIDKSTVTWWLNSDPDFAQALAEINVCKADFFESALIDLVARRDVAAVIFANKTFNRKRGYGDKTSITIEGTVQHTHRLEDLNLPVEVLTQLKAALAVKQGQLLEDKSQVQDADFTIKEPA